MFKLNPIAHQIFEGFLQRIISIDRPPVPGGSFNADFIYYNSFPKFNKASTSENSTFQKATVVEGKEANGRASRNTINVRQQNSDNIEMTYSVLGRSTEFQLFPRDQINQATTQGRISAVGTTSNINYRSDGITATTVYSYNPNYDLYRYYDPVNHAFTERREYVLPLNRSNISVALTRVAPDDSNYAGTARIDLTFDRTADLGSGLTTSVQLTPPFLHVDSDRDLIMYLRVRETGEVLHSSAFTASNSVSAEGFYVYDPALGRSSPIYHQFRLRLNTYSITLLAHDAVNLEAVQGLDLVFEFVGDTSTHTIYNRLNNNGSSIISDGDISGVRGDYLEDRPLEINNDTVVLTNSISSESVTALNNAISAELAAIHTASLSFVNGFTNNIIDSANTTTYSALNVFGGNHVRNPNEILTLLDSSDILRNIYSPLSTSAQFVTNLVLTRDTESNDSPLLLRAASFLTSGIDILDVQMWQVSGGSDMPSSVGSIPFFRNANYLPLDLSSPNNYEVIAFAIIENTEVPLPSFPSGGVEGVDKVYDLRVRVSNDNGATTEEYLATRFRTNYSRFSNTNPSQFGEGIEFIDFAFNTDVRSVESGTTWVNVSTALARGKHNGSTDTAAREASIGFWGWIQPNHPRPADNT